MSPATVGQPAYASSRHDFSKAEVGRREFALNAVAAKMCGIRRNSITAQAVATMRTMPSTMPPYLDTSTLFTVAEPEGLRLC